MQDALNNVTGFGPRLALLLREVATHGDKRAFGELVGLLAPRIKGYLLRLPTDAAIADELVQDVLLAVWHNAGKYDPAQAAVTTWVFTIARNRRIDRLRREWRPEIGEADPLLVPDPAESAEQGIETAERDHRLLRAIRNLPPEQSELLYMAYYQDKPHSGIAAERHLPLGTVKSRLRLALARLRKCLDEDAQE